MSFVRTLSLLVLVMLAPPGSADIDVSILRSLPRATEQGAESASPPAASQEKAEEWYRKALTLDRSESTREQFAEAVFWYRKAADAGHSGAQTSLGLLYSEGQGVGYDPVEALRWFRRAADADNPRAQYSLGLMYHQGQGIEQDFGEAIHWYETAARQGDPNAMNNLAIMHGMGEGVRKSNVEAYAWFALAASHGDANAAGNRDVTAQEMTPEEYRRGRARYEKLEEQLGF